MISTDTICAVSTPAGQGGIAVIRVSGNDAVSICDKIFTPRSGAALSARKPNVLTFGHIYGNGNLIDEVFVVLFRAPHSYTGEDMIEVSCHGSLYIQQEMLRCLLHEGCRLASPGEFTQRAFLNGKIDLSQAEAVADLIASSSAATHRMAMKQMRGGVSDELAGLRDKLLHFTSLVELELDFSEEDVEFADRGELRELAVTIEKTIRRLTNSFHVGNAIKNGIPVAIIGETNVGKSTLLNFLLKEDKAIVSNIHGTTRDVIEDTITIDGILFRFIDTAGIRETHDTIERIGIDRTFQKLKQASIILWVIDSLSEFEEIERLGSRISAHLTGKKVIMVLNKVDLLDEQEKQGKEILLKQLLPTAEQVSISATLQSHTDNLLHKLVQATSLPVIRDEDIIITNARHYEALSKAHLAIMNVISNLDNHLSGELLSQDIRECMSHLGEITGQISNDEVLGNIFNKFCIGK